MKKKAIFLMISIFLFSNLLFAAEINMKDTGDSAEQVSGTQGFIERFQPRAGILPGFAIPVGNVGSVMNAGFGGNIFADIIIPVSFLENKGFLLYGGAMVGYAHFSASASGSSAKINVIPLIVYGEIAYPLSMGISPFVRLGFGGTSVSLTDDSGTVSDASNFDGTLLIGAGAGYRHSAIPYIKFIGNINYMIAFEQVSGHFFYMNVGAAYHFYYLRRSQ